MENNADKELLIKFINNPNDKETETIIQALYRLTKAKQSLGIQFESDSYCCLGGEILKEDENIQVSQILSNNTYLNENYQKNIEFRAVNLTKLHDLLREIGPEGAIIDVSLDYYEIKCFDGQILKIEPNQSNLELIFEKGLYNVLKDSENIYRDQKQQQFQQQQQQTC